MLYSRKHCYFWAILHAFVNQLHNDYIKQMNYKKINQYVRVLDVCIYVFTCTDARMDAIRRVVLLARTPSAVQLTAARPWPCPVSAGPCLSLCWTKLRQALSCWCYRRVFLLLYLDVDDRWIIFSYTFESMLESTLVIRNEISPVCKKVAILPSSCQVSSNGICVSTFIFGYHRRVSIRIWT